MVHVIKRAGHKEKYDERKVYASVYSACAETGKKEKECERAADAVCKSLRSFLKNKRGVTSLDIFANVVRLLKKLDKDAAFMYETHRDIS